MENRDNQDFGQNTDVSKAAQAQQPQNERAQRPEESQATSEPGQAGFEGQADTTTEQRTDIEGSSFNQSSGTGSTSTGEASDIEGSSFVGSDSAGDTSSALVADEDRDFAENDQGVSD